MKASRFTVPLAALILTIATGRVALADPLSDLKNAALATANAHTYHFTMTVGGLGLSEGDMQLPRTMHMTSQKGMEMVVLPAATYMKMGGKWSKFPSVGGDAESNIAAAVAKMTPAKFHVADLGMRSFGGTMMRAYAVDHVSGRDIKMTEYLDGSGRLAGFQSGGMTMRLTKFGEPVHIVAPL